MGERREKGEAVDPLKKRAPRRLRFVVGSALLVGPALGACEEPPIVNTTAPDPPVVNAPAPDRPDEPPEPEPERPVGVPTNPAAMQESPEPPPEGDEDAPPSAMAPTKQQLIDDPIGNPIGPPAGEGLDRRPPRPRTNVAPVRDRALEAVLELPEPDDTLGDVLTTEED
ncbi:MAG TPA: hypothetical protein RMH26_18120 [Polyangiaceae bacterium LLY-WYZ-15_(1-7)]|nr:hypothetical protein [Polyangiaceae bacterium LLY-WYZ-15_(1-7)]